MTASPLFFGGTNKYEDLAMNAPATRSKKYLVLGLLALGCLVLDVAVTVALIDSAKWLISRASPFALAGLAATAIVAVRVFQSMRLVAELNRRNSVAAAAIR